jgi:hypothetical protein
MPRWIRAFHPRNARRFLFTHQQDIYSLMAGMAYTWPPLLVLPPSQTPAGHPERVPDGHLTPGERRLWARLTEE